MPSRRTETLPSLGPPLRMWGNVRNSCNAAKRNEKVGLWCAVALQNHFFRPAGVGGSISGASPFSLPNQQPTLAQKMGLVPLPPPPPTEEDWRCAEARALLREKLKRPTDTLCCICFEPFHRTMRQGQVILSCSHVFHEDCFKQFERFARLRQKDEGAAITTRLACPECRQTNYYKRTYYAGKALAQYVAIVRIQSLIRGHLVRRRYTALRLKYNSEFRDAYVQQRLERLSMAWELYLDQREQERSALLTDLEVRKQEAVAHYLMEDDWRTIISKALAMAHTRNSGSGDRGPALGAEDVPIECSICLSAITRGLSQGSGLCNLCISSQSSLVGRGPRCDEGDDDREYDPITAFRQAYEDKKKSRVREGAHPPKGYPGKGACVKLKMMPVRLKQCTTSAVESRLKGSGKSADVAPDVPQSEGQVAVTRAPPILQNEIRPGGSPHCSHPRRGIILSCGHYFHEKCLSTFERYATWRAVEDGVPLAPRCPLCRCGYVKHTF